MNARLSPPVPRAAHPEASRQPVAGRAGQAQPGSQSGMRAVVERAGQAPTEPAAIRIAIRALSDDELAHEAKVMRQKASYAQGMASRLDREIKRRRNSLRRAVTKANEGK